MKLFTLIVFTFLMQGNPWDFIHLLALPADTSKLLQKPWTIISYMFLHEGFLHIIFNLLWLYFGGQIFMQYLNSKQLLSTYILGGIFGGLSYVLAFNFFPFSESKSGTSLPDPSGSGIIRIISGLAAATAGS